MLWRLNDIPTKIYMPKDLSYLNEKETQGREIINRSGNQVYNKNIIFLHSFFSITPNLVIGNSH